MSQLKLSNLVSQEMQQSQEAELAFAFTMIEQGIAEGVLVDAPPAYLGQIFLRRARSGRSLRHRA